MSPFRFGRLGTAGLLLISPIGILVIGLASAGYHFWDQVKYDVQQLPAVSRYVFTGRV